MASKNQLFVTPVSLFRVFGRDAERYLNGRLTQNIKSLPTGSSTSCLMLSPQGRIQGQMQVVRKPDFFLLLSDPLINEEAVKKFQSDLLQFKVADQVEVEELSSNYKLLTIIGNLDTSIALEKIIGPDITTFIRNRSGLTETSILVSKNKAESTLSIIVQSHPDLTISDSAHHEQLRIENKQPLWGVDLSEKILGSEIDFQDLISFNKGCYVGQEAIEMSVARGKPPRRFVKLTTPEVLSFTPGVDIYPLNNGSPCGFVTSSFANAEKGTVALGFIKNSQEPIEEVTINGNSLMAC